MALVGFQDWAAPCDPCVLPVPPATLELKLWVAVARYEKVSTSGPTLPFETFKFEATASTGARLGVDFIEVQSVHRPCLMIISSDADATHRFETQSNLLRMRWFCIPFDRAVKTDNCEYESYSTSFETAPGMSPFASQDTMKRMLRAFDLHGNHEARITGLDPMTFRETGTVDPPSEDDESSIGSDDNIDTIDWNT